MRGLFLALAFIAGSALAQPTVLPELSGSYARVFSQEARKNCNKGKPCGNTCISIDKICHIGVNPNPPVTPNPPIKPNPPVTPPPIPEVAVKPRPSDCYSATVQRVVDGDTLVVQGREGVEKVRISQIDAPEASQPYGRQATSCLASMVSDQTVNICTDGKDRYGRTVANINVRGFDVGAQMVAQGCAWAYNKYLEAGSNLPALQAQAQAAGQGLWAGQPVAPWEYRGGSAPVPVLAGGRTPVTVSTTTSAPAVERILDWAESAFSDVLQAGSTTLHIPQGAYRCYGNSMCLGVLNGTTMLFDGAALIDVGPPQIYLDQATTSGY